MASPHDVAQYVRAIIRPVVALLELTRRHMARLSHEAGRNAANVTVIVIEPIVVAIEPIVVAVIVVAPDDYGPWTVIDTANDHGPRALVDTPNDHGPRTIVRALNDHIPGTAVVAANDDGTVTVTVLVSAVVSSLRLCRSRHKQPERGEPDNPRDLSGHHVLRGNCPVVIAASAPKGS